MRQARIGWVLGVVTVIVVGLAGPEAAKTVSPERYAKSLCRAVGDVVDAQKQFNDAYGALPVNDVMTFQTQAIEVINVLLADLQAAQASLSRLKPDIRGGRKVSELFSGYIGDQATAVQSVRDAFAIADPNGVAIASDVAAFEVGVTTATLTPNDPFRKVTNRDLLEAFDEESSCEDIVTVF